MLLVVLALGTGCGPGPLATPDPASAPPQAAPEAPSPSLTSAPTALAIDPGNVDPQPPPEPIWSGSDPAGSTVPFHPAIDPQGRIWVGAAKQNRFLVFDRDGQFIESWGTAGSAEGEINFMHNGDSFGGIAFASDGGFFVSESGNRRVSRFDSDRNFQFAFGSFGTGDDQFLVPNAIALDAADNVYVHDDELNVTKMFNPDGHFVRTVAEGSQPMVSVTGDGHVYAAMWQPNLLNEYDPDGVLVRSIDLDGLVARPRAADVKVDAKGHIWISSVTERGPADLADKLVELDRDGTLLHRWDGLAVTQFVIDPQGDRLYATFWEQPFLAAYALPGT